MTHESRADRKRRLHREHRDRVRAERGMQTTNIQARYLRAGMRFMADVRWRKMRDGQVYTIKDIETFGLGREMRWTINIQGRAKIQLRAHETLAVFRK